MKARKPQPEPITVPEPIVPLPGQMELFDVTEKELNVASLLVTNYLAQHFRNSFRFPL